jgi:ankyrin repeat protein
MMEWTKLWPFTASVSIVLHSLNSCMQDKHGETALMAACKTGHLETAKLLLHRRALVNYQSKVRVATKHRTARKFREEFV